MKSNVVNACKDKTSALEVWIYGFIYLIQLIVCARIHRISFREKSQKRSFSMHENERFESVFAKTESINSGTDN